MRYGEDVDTYTWLRVAECVLLAAAPIIEAAALNRAADEIEKHDVAWVCDGPDIAAYLRERARALTEGATDA